MRSKGNYIVGDGIDWKPSKLTVEVQYHPGLPTLQDWLQFGLGGRGVAPCTAGSMTPQDWQECQRMSRPACDDYQRMTPSERDWRNHLPSNDRYDFDQRTPDEKYDILRRR